jgi:hypothetical protein
MKSHSVKGITMMIKIKRVLSTRTEVVLDGVKYLGKIIKTPTKKLFLVLEESKYDYYLVGIIHRPNGRRVFRRNGEIYIELKNLNEISSP